MSANGASIYLAWMGGMIVGIGAGEPNVGMLTAGAALSLAAIFYFRRFGEHG